MENYRIFFTGVGGQGTLLATRILAEAAIHVGLNAQASEVHGMAQRGGVVESAVVIGELKSSIISDGEADVLLGFEPLETYRALRKCSSKSMVISNTAPIIPYSVAIGQMEYPDIDRLFYFIKSRVGRLITLNATGLGEESGSVLSSNMVMLGALAKSGILPIPVSAYEHTLRTRTNPAFLEVNFRAFKLGYEAV